MHPILIVGAVLVGLPILLHLIMKQEPKRLLFPAMRFLMQKQRTNQRKMRLRHFLLLALRMLLIALFALALFQPKIPSAGISFAGEQPVAAILVIDTSPSMGYKADSKSRLDEARRRALELLDELPPGSRVAVLDPADPAAAWEQSAGDARRRIEGMKEPHGGGPPVTASLFAAYQLFRSADQEADGTGAMPRLLAVFSDRTTECWRADRADDLKKAAADLPTPAVAHLFVDVGVDRPANVGITAAQASPQLASANQPVTVTVTIQATGPDVPAAVVRVSLDDGPPERKAVDNLPAGTPRAVAVTFKDLKPGVHQVKATLETDDAMPFDNVRYVTFRVGAARKILTLSDDPNDAELWQLAHEAKGEFQCDVKKPDAATDFGPYEFVCLLDVADPSRPLPPPPGAGAGGGTMTLWDKLAGYVKRGGKVLIIPGPREQVALAAYDPTGVTDPTAGVLPGKLVQVIDTHTFPAPEPPKEPGQPPAPDRRGGVTWAVKPDDRPERHLFTKPFKEWNLLGTVDFLVNPRKAEKYWDVKPVEDNTVSVVVAYDDAEDPTKRHPAVLEKTFPGGGKVLLLTTRLDNQEFGQEWNNYWKTDGSSWAVVFPHLLATYLADNAADAAYNFTTGQPVSIPLPKGGTPATAAAAGQTRKLVFEGPGVSGPEASPEAGDRQAELRLSPARTLTPGNYLLRTEDRSWQEGFSLNPPTEEGNLTKVPTEVIEAVFGPNSVIPIGKDLKLHDVIASKFDPELKLFPWLLIGVLFLFAGEGFVANRFYRLRAKG